MCAARPLGGLIAVSRCLVGWTHRVVCVPVEANPVTIAGQGPIVGLRKIGGDLAIAFSPDWHGVNPIDALSIGRSELSRIQQVKRVKCGLDRAQLAIERRPKEE